MKQKIGPSQGLYAYVLALEPLAADWKLGAQVTIVEAKNAQSDKQRKGFHWLLREWIKLDPQCGYFEDLKRSLLIAQWGAIKVTDEYGNEEFAPLKRTTQEWSWDAKGYVDKPCTKEEYSELIETTYRLCPSALPEMKKEYLDE